MFKIVIVRKESWLGKCKDCGSSIKSIDVLVIIKFIWVVFCRVVWFFYMFKFIKYCLVVYIRV